MSLPAASYETFVTEDFLKTPWIGTLPTEKGKIKEYDLSKYLPVGVEIKEILIYAFISGLPPKQPPKGGIVRAVYEIYTEGTDRRHYSQLMNAVFNQPDTVMNSANLWIPYANTQGVLKARIPETWVSAPKLPDDVVAAEKHTFKNLSEALASNAADNDQNVFIDLFLLGYRPGKPIVPPA